MTTQQADDIRSGLVNADGGISYSKCLFNTKEMKRLRRIERKTYKPSVLTMTYITLHAFVNEDNVIMFDGDYHQWQIAKILTGNCNENYNDTDWALTVLENQGLIYVHRDRIEVLRNRHIRRFRDE